MSVPRLCSPPPCSRLRRPPNRPLRRFRHGPPSPRLRRLRRGPPRNRSFLRPSNRRCDELRLRGGPFRGGGRGEVWRVTGVHSASYWVILSPSPPPFSPLLLDSLFPTRCLSSGNTSSSFFFPSAAHPCCAIPDALLPSLPSPPLSIFPAGPNPAVLWRGLGTSALHGRANIGPGFFRR